MASSTRLTSAPDADSVRRTSIDHHDDVVGMFEEYYRTLERDRFANAFAYGRFKIDKMLDRELAALPRGARVLDVGCGTGTYLRRFAKLGLEPVGLEPAPSMIEVARRENPDVRVEEGLATAIPFEDESFDAVTAIEVLRYLHADDVSLSIREMLRVLRPGGLFFVTLVNRWALDGFYVLQRLRQLGKGIAHDRRNPHCEFTTPREVERLLRLHGAKDVRTTGRLLAPLRVAYKAHEGVGARLASLVEGVDDRLHEEVGWTKALAGHLIAYGHR